MIKLNLDNLWLFVTLFFMYGPVHPRFLAKVSLRHDSSMLMSRFFSLNSSTNLLAAYYLCILLLLLLWRWVIYLTCLKLSINSSFRYLRIIAREQWSYMFFSRLSYKSLTFKGYDAVWSLSMICYYPRSWSLPSFLRYVFFYNLNFGNFSGFSRNYLT